MLVRTAVKAIVPMLSIAPELPGVGIMHTLCVTNTLSAITFISSAKPASAPRPLNIFIIKKGSANRRQSSARHKRTRAINSLGFLAINLKAARKSVTVLSALARASSLFLTIFILKPMPITNVASFVANLGKITKNSTISGKNIFTAMPTHAAT